MKRLFFLIIPTLVLFSCKKTTPINPLDDTVISQLVHIKQDKDYLNLDSGKFHYRLKKTQLPFQKVILLNASMSGYLSALQLQDRVIGVSSPRFIYDPKMRALIKAGKIQNVGSEQKYNIEKIISLKPDAIFQTMSLLLITPMSY